MILLARKSKMVKPCFNASNCRNPIFRLKAWRIVYNEANKITVIVFRRSLILP